MTDIFIVVFAIVILFKFSSLSSSVKKLESEVSDLKKQIPRNGVQATYASTPSQISQPSAELDVAPNIETSNLSYVPDTETVSADVETESDISKWFKENLLLKIGVLMILAGFGWFVSYAFIHNWIGPVGRITLGFVVGSLITIFGTIRLGKNQVQGNLFTILGSALIIITVLAGEYYYSFFTPTMVLGIAFMVSVYISLTALAHSVEKLAIYGLLVSLSAPFFSHTSSMDPTILYFYLALISVASIWLSIGKGWRSINSVGITGVFIYSVQIIFDGGVFLESKYIVLGLIYAISVVYLIVSLWSLIGQREKATPEDVYLTVLNSILMLGATMHIVPPVYQSLIIAVWMLVYALSGFFVFIKTKNEKLFYIHSLVAVFLLAMATSIELSGPTLVIALAIEAAIVSISSFIVTNKMKIAHWFGFLVIVPALMSLSSFTSSAWRDGIFQSDFVVLLVLAVVLAALGFIYRLRKTENSSDLQPHQLVFTLSTVYIYSIIWLSAHSLLLDSDSAVFLSLFIYTIIGLATHFIGLFKGNDVLKNYGKVLLVLVVLRLLFVDVWNMELALRVVTFIVLGVMFISTAFIGKSKKLPTNSISQ